MHKSRLWTLAMALAASMGRPGSGQARQLESELQSMVQDADESRAADPESAPESPRKDNSDPEPRAQD